MVNLSETCNIYKGVRYNESNGQIYPTQLNHKGIPIWTLYYSFQEFKEAIDKIDEEEKKNKKEFWI